MASETVSILATKARGVEHVVESEAIHHVLEVPCEQTRQVRTSILRGDAPFHTAQSGHPLKRTVFDRGGANARH